MKLNIKLTNLSLLYALTIVFALSGCASKKSSTERTVLSDTLNTSSIQYVSRPIATQFTVTDICDSLGNAKEVSKIESSGTNKAKLRTENNNLYLELLTGESKKQTDTIYKTKYRYKTKEVEVKRNVVAWWHWALHLLLLISLALLMKKYVPFI